MSGMRSLAALSQKSRQRNGVGYILCIDRPRDLAGCDVHEVGIFVFDLGSRRQPAVQATPRQGFRQCRALRQLVVLGMKEQDRGSPVGKRLKGCETASRKPTTFNCRKPWTGVEPGVDSP